MHDNSVARVVLTSDFVRNESYFVPEMDELKLTFTPRTLRAKSDNVKPLYVFGDVTVESAGNRAKQSVFHRDRKNYVRIDDPDQEMTLGADEETEISIRRPAGMSMTDFLRQTVTFRAEFYQANSAGSATLWGLGSATSQMTVRDLIFASMRGTMNVFTREKRSGRREANLVLDVSTDNGVRVVSGSYDSTH